MSQARVLGLIGVAALAAAAVAYAQTTVTPIPDNEPVQSAPLSTAPEQATWGDVDAGATKAGTCAACHGLDGNPTDLQYPRLAGQSERYIAQQIALFKSGERNTGMAAMMKPFADMLSAQDARDIGAYYATQNADAGVADDTVVTEGPYAGLKFYQIGQKLFRSGDAERGIPACMACHGPDGAGNPGPPYPYVAGQPSQYSQRRLEEYRAGETVYTDPRLYNIMVTVASKLTDEEIGALSSYMEGLHPRANDYAAASAPPAPAPAAPAAPTPPAESVEDAQPAIDMDADAEAGPVSGS
ncbi:c-type cytochrome [Lysobacter sp. A3-1-A15]|uniref:c-type cytochrome n=1 Tax=Novilysobacter viscosus TaxID=3098602 RepID=UPI002EDB2683